MNTLEINPDNPIVYLDIMFGQIKAGRVIIELFKNIVPKTAENFRRLCTGEHIGENGKILHYKGTQFHRVVPCCLVQGGGDVNGAAGESIYGADFADENFLVRHDRGGIIGMSSDGQHTNCCQFYITTMPCPQLEGRNVAFGVVRAGLNTVVEMADLPRAPQTDKPLAPGIFIADCGELVPGAPLGMEETDGTPDKYPPWPQDWDCEGVEVEIIGNVVEAIKESGNHYFRSANFLDAERKYVKALRYLDWATSASSSKAVAGFNHNHHQQLKSSCMLNLAAAQLKLEKYKDTVEICTKLIAQDDRNGKAFYRRAQARLILEEYDLAVKDFNAASKLYPKDAAILSGLQSAKQCKFNYLQREKQLYANIFHV